MIWDVVPGTAFATGAEALASVLADAKVLRVATAFVTPSGIDELAEVLMTAGAPETVQVVTRATHTTATRDDLLALQDRVGAEVRAFVGAEAGTFHPKWFLALASNEVRVLSGSGNVTRGGLISNREQFELLRIPIGEARSRPAAANQFQKHLTLDLTRRWANYWQHAFPLASALAHPAFAAWEQQAALRKELGEQLRALELEVELQADGAEPHTEVELEHSRTATEQKVRRRMEAWFPDARIRQRVYDLLAHAMGVCNRENPDGWYAGYVTDSRWGGNRLSVNARHAQAFLAHSDGEVYFPAPPEQADAAAFELARRLGDLPGVRIEPSKIGERDDDREHPYVCVPAASLEAALVSGAQDLIDATVRWRIADGRSPKWRVHSPALVRVVARESGRVINQPAYED